MFCQKCGKQIREGSRFCPYCGEKNVSGTGTQSQAVPATKEKKKRKKKKTPVVIIAMAVLLVLGIVIFSGGGSSIPSERLIALVQDGYLGNYDTVTIKEVLDYTDEGAKWDAGEAVSGEYYIVEYRGDGLTIQFSVNGPEEEVFKVSGVEAAELEGSDTEAYDVKVYLDGIYQLYANAHPEKGLYIDTGTSNDTLEGHVGPVRPTGEPENALSPTEALVEDLAEYADYTEDELAGELGCGKNEYGLYPDDTHVNFYFMDGKMYMVMLSKPEDVGKSLCGVDLRDSVEEADAVLESRGFIRNGSFASAGLDGNGSFGTADASVISYTENGTGYSYYVHTDADGNITSLSYGLEKEDPIYGEEQPEEESKGIIAEPLTYGTYSFDDGAGTTGTAEVGFFTDDEGGSYIRIGCWQNDREIVRFEGTLEENGEGYHAYDKETDVGIFVTFADGGLYVRILDPDSADISGMEGFYSLAAALNLNEAG